MGAQPKTDVQSEREGLFARLLAAFMQRDFGAFEEAVRPDVVLELPGTSWLAGTYHDYEAFGRYILALRQVLRAAEKPITYRHRGNVMTVQHDIVVSGPKHVTEMALRIKVRFDDDGKTEAVFVEPDDLGLFDHVVNTSLGDFQAS
jgi:ketosteroid isomerase-like protein